MHYIFDHFEFDSTSLVLTKKGDTVAIRHNEAKVLALLLGQANKVLTKEDILAHVWQDKVVSEQAVFQNISHLRNLLGKEAIKTFPKRGYQWQLETKQSLVTHSPDQDTDQDTDQTAVQSIYTKQACKKTYWPYLVLLSILLMTIWVIYSATDFKQTKSDTLVKLAYIPFYNAQDKTSLLLEDNNLYDFTALTQLNTAQFEASIALEYPHLAKQHPFILMGKIRTNKHKTYGDFLLKGPFGDWQGQLSASSQAEIIKQLEDHLQQPFIVDLLSKPHSLELKQAKLSIAYQQVPTDLITLGQLIRVYIKMAAFEKAMVSAAKLENIAREQQNAQQLGNALLFQSEILTRKELYDLSSHKLKLAIEQFVITDDLKRQAGAWYAQSWLDHQQNDYIAIKVSLLKSAKLSMDSKDIEGELDALIYLSVMAYKYQQEIDKYQYLQEAENKMKTYQLPVYHFARIPFHYAMFAKTPSDREPHYKQVLKFTALTADHWVAQESRKQLMKYYINQHRLEEAQALVDDLTTDNPQNSYLKTLLAQAKKQMDAFNHFAQRTFEQALFSGDKQLSLDVALLLCGNTSRQVNDDFYSQYIEQNATKYWRRNNEETLLALNL